MDISGLMEETEIGKGLPWTRPATEVAAASIIHWNGVLKPWLCNGEGHYSEIWCASSSFPLRRTWKLTRFLCAGLATSPTTGTTSLSMPTRSLSATTSPSPPRTSLPPSRRCVRSSPPLNPSLTPSRTVHRRDRLVRAYRHPHQDRKAPPALHLRQGDCCRVEQRRLALPA